MDMERRRESSEVNRELGSSRFICRTIEILLRWRTDREKRASDVVVVALGAKEFSFFTTKSMLNYYIPSRLSEL